MAVDAQYAIARQLLDFGDAITRLRERASMTRGQLGKRLGVKARNIAIAEEETPRVPAGGGGSVQSSRPDADSEHAAPVRGFEISADNPSPAVDVGPRVIRCLRFTNRCACGISAASSLNLR